MKRFWLTLVATAVLGPTILSAQQAKSAANTIYDNLAGHWTGVLEYRDYSAEATSTSRTKLPTWLDIQATPDGKALSFRYTYDDGPSKTVHESATVTIDTANGTWTVASGSDPEEVAQIDGLATLKEGRGKLNLRGAGTENGKRVDVRTSVTIGRNLLTMERYTRLPGQEFTFRHVYTFTRNSPPAEAHVAPVTSP